MDQMKKAFKGLFRKKPKKEEPKPTTTTEPASPAQTNPTETTPAAPAPATAPAPVKTETTPVATGSAPVEPAQPAAVPAQGETNKDEVAALAEIKKATQSRLTSHTSKSQQYDTTECWSGSRRRQKVAMDNERDSPL